MEKPKKAKPSSQRRREKVADIVDLLEIEELPASEAAKRDADASFQDHRDAILQAFRSYCN